MGDDDSVAVDLPFEFTFYGEKQNRVKISSNGFLSFRSPRYFIAVHRDDLDPRQGGTIHYKNETDRFIVQFTDISHFNFGPIDENLLNTFQIVLYVDGSIEFHYLDIMTDFSQTVGIESPSVPGGLPIKSGSDNTFSADSTSVLITPTVPWLNTPYQEGNLSGDEGQSLTLDFNAADLEEKVYNTTLYITSNDQASPVRRIPVSLNVTSALVTGVETPEMQKAWSIYPVPVKDHLDVRLNKEMTLPAAITIVNLHGQIVVHQKLEPKNFVDHRIHLNLMAIPPGMYILQLTGQGLRTAKVFVKE